MNYPTNRCKSCGQQIVWATTEAGKAMPLDFPPEKRFVLVELNGNDLGGRMMDTWMSHFITCPHASEHRKSPS